jgi:hypothetical protein
MRMGLPVATFIFILLIQCISLASVSPYNETVVVTAFDQGLKKKPYSLSALDLISIEQNFSNAQKKDPELLYEAPQEAYRGALRLLSDGRIQEAIWLMDRGGLYGFAEEISGRLEKILLNGSLNILSPVGVGITGALHGSIGSFKLIIKPTEAYYKDSVRTESAVYKLARLLGLPIVVTTVSRNLNGAAYSVQVAIQGATHSGLNFLKYPVLYVDAFSDIFLLDYLLQNSDRHEQNSLTGLDQRTFSIDNARANFSGIHNSIDITKEINFSPQLLTTLFHISIKDLQTAVSDSFTQEEIVILMGRIDALKTQLFQVRNLKIDSAMPLRPFSTRDRLLFSHERIVRQREAVIEKLRLQKEAEAFAARMRIETRLNSLAELGHLSERLQTVSNRSELVLENGRYMTQNGQLVIKFLELQSAKDMDSIEREALQNSIALFLSGKLRSWDLRSLVIHSLEAMAHDPGLFPHLAGLLFQEQVYPELERREFTNLLSRHPLALSVFQDLKNNSLLQQSGAFNCRSKFQ